MSWHGSGADPDPPTTPLPVGMRVRTPSAPAPSRTAESSRDAADYRDDYRDDRRDDYVDEHDRYEDDDYEDDYEEIPTQAGPPPAEHRAAGRRPAVLLAPLLAGALVAVAIGVYGRTHEPIGYAVNLAGFSSAGYVKAWLGSVALLFAIVQLVSAKLMYRRGAPAWAPTLHVWSGRLAVLVSVPVAVHCLYALGYQSDSTRVWLHSLGGCLFYGAFTAKMLSLGRAGAPRWAIPLLGGLTFTFLIVIWLTSALWLFSRQGVHL